MRIKFVSGRSRRGKHSTSKVIQLTNNKIIIDRTACHDDSTLSRPKNTCACAGAFVRPAGRDNPTQFVVTPVDKERSYILDAGSQKEMHHWVVAIRKHAAIETACPLARCLVLEQAVYENQRYNMFSGWDGESNLLPTDRGPWTDETGTASFDQYHLSSTQLPKQSFRLVGVRAHTRAGLSNVGISGYFF